MSKVKSKYKKGDVLTTKMGRIFTITGVRKKQVYKNVLSKEYTGVYLLSNHPFPAMPIDYIDSAETVMLASKAARILYGK